ncbi:MAG: PAS domain-containing protein, partial [bacterium]|nr:PAS domain-containing protein [bacterium]
MLGALLMALVLFLPSAVTLPLVDPATLPLGPLIGDAPVFVYYPELAQISLVQEGERTFLRVDSDNRGDERYNGFGFFGEFVVPQNAALRFEWRGTVKGHSPSLHIVDASPDRPRPDRGEIYTWKMPYPESEWQVLEIALSNFRRDEEQFEDVPNDGVLHSNGIPNVEIGFELNTYAQLDFRHAGFVWSAPRGPTYLALVLGLVTGVLLLVHSSRLRGVSARLDSPSGDDSATVVYPLTCLVLTVSVLADVQHTLTITEALALSGMFVLVVVDKLLASTSRSHVFWDLRYVILLSGIWWVGEALPPLFPVVLLFVALLSAASKQRRGVLLTAAALPLAAVVLRPPLLDISDKGPTLFYITMVGALALGAAEILRSSEVRDQHRRTAMMYRGILEQISDGVVLVEFNGRIELANRGFESLLSADPGELLGHHVSDFLRAKDG